jgi:hypothetical protein
MSYYDPYGAQMGGYGAYAYDNYGGQQLTAKEQKKAEKLAKKEAKRAKKEAKKAAKADDFSLYNAAASGFGYPQFY